MPVKVCFPACCLLKTASLSVHLIPSTLLRDHFNDSQPPPPLEAFSSVLQLATVPLSRVCFISPLQYQVALCFLLRSQRTQQWPRTSIGKLMFNLIQRLVSPNLPKKCWSQDANVLQEPTSFAALLTRSPAQSSAHSIPSTKLTKSTSLLFATS